MKFKATLSDRGLRILEKGFLPTLEKLGKRCQLLLSPEDVHFIQAVSDTDGLHVSARLANVSHWPLADPRLGSGHPPSLRAALQAVLFEEEGFKCQSRYDNRIAFALDLPLLLKVLRAAVSHDADALHVKLAMRSIHSAPGWVSSACQSPLNSCPMSSTSALDLP